MPVYPSYRFRTYLRRLSLGGMIAFLLLLALSLSAQQLDDLSEFEFAELFKRKSEQRIRDLELAIQEMVDRSLDYDLRQDAVDLGASYFSAKENEFEVSNVRSGTKTAYTVYDYFSRLTTLDYDHIDIDWVDFRWVSKPKRHNNGKYYGVFRIIQTFRGERDGRTYYKDVTTKIIEVEIEVLEMDLGNNETRDVVVVRLGNVRVTETRA